MGCRSRAAADAVADVKLFDQTLPATVENVSWLRRAIKREFVGLRVHIDLMNDVLLAIAELATNAVVHAAVPPSQIGIRIDLIGASLRIEIFDDGGPFTDFKPKWDLAARKDIVASGFNGLGLALANALLRDVTYEPGTDGGFNRFTGWRPLQRSRPTILIVDDDETLLRLYTSVLKRRYRILCATSVALALGLARTETVDLILSDYHLGDEVGTSLLSALERDAERLPVPVIMLSADRSVKNRQSADGFGIEMFLIKPIAPIELRDAVERVMTRSRKRLTGMFRYFGANVERLASKPDEAGLNRFGVAHRYAAANAGGGDFLLHLVTDTGQNRFVLADVMGHGLKAKAGAIAYAAMLRSVHAMLPAGADPGLFLTKLSNIACRDAALSEVIATLVVVDQCADGVLEIASAAHPAPVVIGPGTAQVIDGSGPLIGLIENAAYPVARVRLNEGERLVLVTDGVEPKYLAGGGTLPADLVSCMQTASGETVTAAGDAAERWALAVHGPSPLDDWTIMLIGARPDGG
ncbi:MAG: SpoIIE family protein phosphatase [Hyphomicrobiaceae bacterium]